MIDRASRTNVRPRRQSCESHHEDDDQVAALAVEHCDIDGSTDAETHSISLLAAACQKLESSMGTRFGTIDQSILKDIAQFKAS